MSLATVLTDIKTILEANSLTEAKDMFTYENVPSSITNNAYRIELVAGDTQEESSGGMIADVTIDVYVAFVIPRGNFTATLLIAKTTFSETIRAAVLAICENILTGLTFETVPGTKVTIMKLSFQFIGYTWSLT